LKAKDSIGGGVDFEVEEAPRILEGLKEWFSHSSSEISSNTLFIYAACLRRREKCSAEEEEEEEEEEEAPN